MVSLRKKRVNGERGNVELWRRETDRRTAQAGVVAQQRFSRRRGVTFSGLVESGGALL